ncbi:hypothetical protein C0W54_20925 [Photobacterium kishitanii]|uniref:hypothetical protein n=1 Tax=Photobacterium kishitanii TaxID=318456 RepID=UPI000D16A746|nr:hypothetical protein [Photobacterium kishitanii]PSW58835.1 hypothetical protein C0W54_20925 [Photobacterium kishitanii]
MENLYLLDRNALSDIKKSIDGARVDPERLNELKKIDIEGNLISGYLAVREGQSKKIESSEEIECQIEKDLPYLDLFYTKAKTDGKILLDNKKVTAKCLGHVEGRELNWDIYIQFIKYVQKILYQPIKPSKRLEYAENIISKARALSVPSGHLIIICAISSLYGNSWAKKILKSKLNFSKQQAEEAAYNALSDLICLTRTLEVKLKFYNSYEVQFFTFDKPLLNFFLQLKINKISSISNNGINVNITYPREMFPELSDNEYDQLMG